MAYRARVRREQLCAENDLSQWPSVDTSMLSGERRLPSYQAREDIVRDYFTGLSLATLTKKHGVSRQHIDNLVKKCLRPHPDGKIWGFRGLLLYRRQKNYDRQAPVVRNALEQRGGAAGALGQLFERYPDIEEEIETYFLKKTEKILVHESRISFKSTHKRFIDGCRARGIKFNEYPFNVKNLGYRALVNRLHKLASAKFGEAVRARFGKNAARGLRLGGPEQEILPTTRPYSRVEFDGHKIDISFVLRIPFPFGGFTDAVVHRVWLLVIRDVFSGAIIAYHLAFGREYNKFEVMQCIKKAIVPWAPGHLTLPGLAYPAGGGMPSAVIEELAWATFVELRYDNAKAHLSDDVTRIVVDVTGGNVNAGPVDFPERRAMVERFFGLFEENGFHRLPSTLGGNPQDPRRTDPEKLADKYKIRLEHIEELVEVLIADHNGTPTARNGYRSPLEQLRLFVSDPNVLVPKLEEGKRRRLTMLNLRLVRTIRGSVQRGRRPYVEIEGARYTNEILSSSPELIGKRLTLYVDPDEARYAEAYFSDGSELGVLEAVGFWGRTRHTMEMRRAIMHARNKQLIHYTEHDDPIHIYMDYLNTEAHKNKRARKHLIKAQKAVNQIQQGVITNEGPQPTTEPETGGKSAIDPAMMKQKGFNY